MKHLTPEARIQKFRPKIEFLECFSKIFEMILSMFILFPDTVWPVFRRAHSAWPCSLTPLLPLVVEIYVFKNLKMFFFEVEDLKKTKKCEEDFLELVKMMSCHIFLSLLRAAISLPLDSPSLLRLTPPRSSKNLSRFLKLGLNDFLISSKMNIFTQKLKKNCSFVS